MRMCVHAYVFGGGFLDISVAGVRLKRLHSIHINAKPEKHMHILFIFYTGRGSSVVSV